MLRPSHLLRLLYINWVMARNGLDDLILATWYMAEHGRVPANGLEYKVGRSGGGFDRLDLKFRPESEWIAPETAVNLTLPLNRRSEDRKSTRLNSSHLTGSRMPSSA